MKKIVKQVVGIDIGKSSFYACYKVKSENNKIIIKGCKSFENNKLGFELFYAWCKKRCEKTSEPLLFVMEATGVYYEELAYYLHHNTEAVSVQLAQKLKYYAKSCNLKTKTDKVDSKMIAEYGIEKNMTDNDFWTPPGKYFKTIRDLAREHTSLKGFKVACQNQLHALIHAYEANPKVISMKEDQILFYQQQLESVEEEMKRLVKEDDKLFLKVKNIESVKGLGFITVIKILAETNGFALFESISQLVSYAGLDVVASESGQFKGRTKISKKGNVRIRSALYMPAISALQHNSTLKTFYNRVNENRVVKKQGVVAVMRKLLILIYTLWKKEEAYIENYAAV